MFAKTITPLAKQAAYQEAISKVVEISRALTATTDQLNKRKSELWEMQNKVTSPPSLVDRALALAGGSPLSANPPVATTTSEIKRLEEEVLALQQGLRAASDAAELVDRKISHEMGLKSKPAHLAAVKKILECLEALCEANKAEIDIRRDLMSLGYHSHGLVAKHFAFVGEIDDRNGTPAFYYAQDSRQYIES